MTNALFFSFYLSIFLKAVAGLVADARQLVNRAQKEAQSYKTSYYHAIPLHVLSARVSGFVQAYTLYSHVRPFGTAAILGGYDDNGPQLFMIKPSGISWVSFFFPLLIF